jgi:hypothetical protein
MAHTRKDADSATSFPLALCSVLDVSNCTTTATSGAFYLSITVTAAARVDSIAPFQLHAQKQRNNKSRSPVEWPIHSRDYTKALGSHEAQSRFEKIRLSIGSSVASKEQESEYCHLGIDQCPTQKHCPTTEPCNGTVASELLHLAQVSKNDSSGRYGHAVVVVVVVVVCHCHSSS